MWVRADGVFAPIVSSEEFLVARGIIHERFRRFSNEEMLTRLKSLASEHAVLSSQIIDAAEGLPSSGAYRSRFGSLLQAYRLAGFEPERDYRYLKINRELRSLYPKMVADLTERLHAVGATVTRDTTTDLLLVNGEFSAAMVLSRCRQTPVGSLRWLIQIDQGLAPDITILVRMDATNCNPADYYLLPIMDIDTPRLLLWESNGAHLDTYQFDSLNDRAQFGS